MDPEHFVIFGSGPLLLHGLRDDIADLDVLARGPAWRRACADDDHHVGLGPHSRQPMLSFFGGTVEISEHWIDDSWDVDQLIDTADPVEIDGVRLRFARLSMVWNYKLNLNRPKDLRDLRAMRPRLQQGHPCLS